MPATTVLNVHAMDPGNVGDTWSPPARYFDLADAFVHIREVPRLLEDPDPTVAVVVGGGGLLGHSAEWDRLLARLARRPGVCIGWGIGLNAHTRPFKARDYLRWPARWARGALRGLRHGPARGGAVLPDYASGFDLLGVRDHLPDADARWVPCASCMHPGLDASYEPRRRLGVFEHRGLPIRLPDGVPERDRLSNACDDIEAVLEFIGTSEALLTSSYHGAYWGILLGKKVVVYRPFSTKFLHWRHPPAIYSGDLERDLSRCPVHPQALQECRDASRRFHRDVMEALGRPGAARGRGRRPQVDDARLRRARTA